MVQNEFDAVIDMAGNAPQTISSEWIIDTGANEHMIGSLSLLQSFHPTADISNTVHLPNGSRVAFNKTGTVSLTDSITLDHVLYIPNFKSNQLPCPILPKLSVVFSFYPIFCLFQYLRTRRVIGIGKERLGLYHFSGEAISKFISKDSIPLPTLMSNFVLLHSCSASLSCSSVNIDT